MGNSKVDAEGDGDYNDCDCRRQHQLSFVLDHKFLYNLEKVYIIVGLWGMNII
jgi:hypothetical protein